MACYRRRRDFYVSFVRIRGKAGDRGEGKNEEEGERWKDKHDHTLMM